MVVGLEVNQVQVGGSEVGAQSHVWVLELAQDPPVELGANAVELHDVAGILLDPEALEFLHQVTCHRVKKQPIYHLKQHLFQLTGICF